MANTRKKTLIGRINWLHQNRFTIDWLNSASALSNRVSRFQTSGMNSIPCWLLGWHAAKLNARTATAIAARAAANADPFSLDPYQFNFIFHSAVLRSGFHRGAFRRYRVRMRLPRRCKINRLFNSVETMSVQCNGKLYLGCISWLLIGWSPRTSKTKTKSF